MIVPISLSSVQNKYLTNVLASGVVLIALVVFMVFTVVVSGFFIHTVQRETVAVVVGVVVVYVVGW